MHATPRSISTIRAPGYWAWRLRRDTACGPHLKFVSLTCKLCSVLICRYLTSLVTLHRDINYLSCPSPPPGIVSTKQQREKYRQRLLAAFEPRYHPDHSIPSYVLLCNFSRSVSDAVDDSEFKEAFPAGRFRPVCKVQARRGGEMAAVADTIKPPEWWHSTRIIQAFDAVLEDKVN